MNNQEKSAELSITVKSQDGAIICFKLKPKTVMKKLMEAFCTRHGMEVSQVKFVYDGVRVRNEDTPESLNMEDQDEIDAVTEQQGGGNSMAF